MLKKVQDKTTYIKCCNCQNEKKITLYKMKWQKEFRICNNCKDYGSIFNNKPAVVFKKVKCLRCEETFKGTSANRICPNCKETEGYNHATYMESITMGVAL